MNKQDLVEKIIQTLDQEIKIIEQSAYDAQEEARGNDSLSESQTDNRALEASRLAEAQLLRVKEAQRKLTAFRQMALKTFDKDDPVAATALVEVLHKGEKLLFFISPHGAGTSIEYMGRTVELISPLSPLGDALMDQYVGDTVTVETPKGELEYEIISIS